MQIFQILIFLVCIKTYYENLLLLIIFVRMKYSDGYKKIKSEIKKSEKWKELFQEKKKELFKKMSQNQFHLRAPKRGMTRGCSAVYIVEDKLSRLLPGQWLASKVILQTVCHPSALIFEWLECSSTSKEAAKKKKIKKEGCVIGVTQSVSFL